MPVPQRGRQGTENVWVGSSLHSKTKAVTIEAGSHGRLRPGEAALSGQGGVSDREDLRPRQQPAHRVPRRAGAGRMSATDDYRERVFVGVSKAGPDSRLRSTKQRKTPMTRWWRAGVKGRLRRLDSFTTRSATPR